MAEQTSARISLLFVLATIPASLRNRRERCEALQCNWLSLSGVFTDAPLAQFALQRACAQTGGGQQVQDPQVGAPR